MIQYTFAALRHRKPPTVHEEMWDTVEEAQTQAKAWTLLCGPDNPDIMGLALVEVEGDIVRPYQGQAPGEGWQEVSL